MPKFVRGTNPTTEDLTAEHSPAADPRASSLPTPIHQEMAAPEELLLEKVPKRFRVSLRV